MDRPYLPSRGVSVTRFFARPEQIAGGLATLDADDTYHLRVVLRAQPGEKIAVLDGTGREFPGALETIGKTKATVRLGTPCFPATEPRTRITVAQALPKIGDKMEQILQHGTEIGASAFRAFASERSLTQLTGERQVKRLARWHGIIKTAAEQSHRALLPTIEAAGEFANVLAITKKYHLALLAHPAENGQNLREVLSAFPAPPQTLLVLVGPESGFSPGEARQAVKSGAIAVSLGPRILRTETAALVLLSQILYALE